MYNYTICDQPDSKLFEKQCLALEKHIPNLMKEDLMEDVDGSQQCMEQRFSCTTANMLELFILNQRLN